MNLTTLTISGLAIALFAAAIAVRSTQKHEADREGWRRLPPVSPAPAVEPVVPPADTQLEARTLPDLERTYEHAVRKDARAKQQATEALDDMRHARRKLAEAHETDEFARAHWQRSYRSAGLRFESARHERRKALVSIDGVRRALTAQIGGSPSRVSLDSSK